MNRTGDSEIYSVGGSWGCGYQLPVDIIYRGVLSVSFCRA
jgi:hypothetical protein